jgi:DNA-binding transcriptional LysR family regulator
MPDIDVERIRRLDGSLLLVLRELMRHRRTTVAAERLGMSQSAVSHALKRLRLVFDDPLFTRRPHGMEPTARAIELAPKVDALLAAMADAVGVDDGFEPATAVRELRIGAPDHVSTLIAAPLVSHLVESAPTVRLSCAQHLGDVALEAVRRGDIDLALGRFARRPSGDLVVEALYEDRYCLVARRDHPHLGRRLTTEAFSELGHVQVSVARGARRDEVDRLLGSIPPRRTIASVPRFGVAFTVVAATDAVALSPRRLVEAHGGALGLVAHELPFDTEPMRVMAVRRERADAAVRWLVELVRNLDVVQPG